jgi:enoyl-CoA hydratase/carnithine racemase
LIYGGDNYSDAGGIVLIGNDKAFSAGTDVSEFGTPMQFEEPILHSVIETPYI